MKRQALLIGSEMGGLEGVLSDVRKMGLMLEKFGFRNDFCMGPDATREGILNAYEKLIDQAAADDAVVIYFSGHGSLVVPRQDEPMEGIVVPRHIQCIVPVDYDKSTRDDFRAITSYELSELLHRLTEKTHNVAMILDCCHSARMSRSTGARPKALPHPRHVPAAQLFNVLKSRGIDLSRTNIYSNPHAVRIVGSGELQSSYEYLNADGEYVGALTEALLLAFKDLPDPTLVTWRDIGDRVREHVVDLFTSQRPEVEGPANRRLFSLEEPSRETSVAAKLLENGNVELRIGKLMGVRKGDAFWLLPMGANEPLEHESFGTAEVIDVRAVDCVAKVRDAKGDIPEVARAFPIRFAGNRQRVVVDTADDTIRAAVTKELARSPALEVVTERSSTMALATVSVTEKVIRVEGGDGTPGQPASYTPANLTTLRKNLHSAAIARKLRQMESSPSGNLREEHLEVEFGRLENGQPIPITSPHEEIGNGTYVYLRMCNRSAKRIYVSVVDIGVDDQVSLPSKAWEGGIALGPGDEEWFARDAMGQLVGIELYWPDHTPKDRARDEQFLVIATEAQVDLTMLQTPGQMPMAHAARGLRDLEELIEQMGGRARNGRIPTRPQDGFVVRRVPFILHPVPLTKSAPFLVDTRPAMSMVECTPKGGKREGRIAIRSSDVVIKNNRALWGATDIRIDTFVITRGRAKSGRPHRVETVRFPEVNDGAVLPIGKLLIYHGDVSDFVDIAVWVSKDRSGSPTLAQILETQLKSPDLQVQLTKLAEVASVTPESGTVLAAASAAVAAAQIVQAVLLQVTGKTIGLYRTSFLAAEEFGVGKHEIEGRDFSMVVEVEAVA